MNRTNDHLPDQTIAELAELERGINRLQREIRRMIQDQLRSLAGRSLAELSLNRQLAERIQQLLDGHGLRVRCSECGHPAILRVSPRRGAPAGVFVFDHTIDGRRTFHGGKQSVPEIRLVAKPPRRKQRAPGTPPPPAKKSTSTTGKPRRAAG